ncbi:HK97 family phage portal protein [Paracoccus pantotrophus]|uniref:Phage portal protein n=1 Tax=Paracoccus pantotrophus TaxID=82367 RepID=A0AAE6TUS4_PARPN|nr:phage portal protein [Paracoccus pantotrophus]QFG38311.1 phage portal protein [Paracoccus pantotrophus]RKS51171.1 HK97 family phage portal protein [Paracoccus pantotrophus]
MDLPRGIVDRFGRPMAALSDLTKEQRLTLQGGDLGYYVASNASGKVVTLSAALTISAVWACIVRSAQAMASLPLDLYRKTAGGRQRQDGALADLISLSPNADQTPVEFWEGMFSWMLATGNAYAEIDRVNGRPSSLMPLPATHVRPFRNKVSGELFYEVREPGTSRPRVIGREDMFHLRGWGFGGDEGMSPIRWGTQSLGAAMAADEASAKMFGSGMQASGVLKTNQRISPEQRPQLQAMMSEYAGSTKAGKLMILEAGMEFEQLTLNPDDAQMLETRRFSIEEVCRWFGVPPIVIGHSAAGQTMWGTGVEQIFLSWMQLGINPVLKKVEQRIRKQLIPLREQRDTYAEFNREAMLQMDSKAKAEFIRAMVTMGVMKPDEARDKLNIEREGGAADLLWMQGAMKPMDMILKGK